MKIIGLTALILFACTSFAKIFDWTQGTGFVEFRATGHPSAIHIVGKGEHATGKFTLEERTLKGEAEFKLATLDTQNQTRNQHMKEKYLEVGLYPSAKLTLDKCELPFELKDGFSAKDVPFTAHLTLHGVTKPLSGTVMIEQRDQVLMVKAEFKIKVNDYSISIPTFMGITMADEVAVTVQETFPKTSIN